MIKLFRKLRFQSETPTAFGYLGAFGFLILGLVLHILLGDLVVNRPLATYFLLTPAVPILFGFGPGILMVVGSVFLAFVVQPIFLHESTGQILFGEVLLASVYLVEVFLLLAYIRYSVKKVNADHKKQVRNFEKKIDLNDEFLKILQLAFDLTNDVIVIGKAKLGGEIMYVNHAFTRVTQYSQDEIMGGSLKLLFGPETDTNTIFLLENAIERAIPIRIDVLGYKKSGNEFWSELDVSPIIGVDGKENYWIAIIRNIHERKEYEFDLKRSKIEAREEATFRSLIIAKIAHEIRTPMTGVIGMAQLALNENSLSSIKKSLNLIQTSSLDLMRVLDSVLDFAKLEAKKMALDIAPFRCEDLIRNTENLYTAYATLKNIRFETSIDSRIQFLVLGDAFRISQVLNNLVANALKFTHAGFIQLGIDLIEQKDQQAIIRFRVIDSGIGISSEALPNILNPYVQADNSLARLYGGSGLGLSICQKLLKLMSSKISIQSIHGQGSEFSFCLQLPISPDLSKALANGDMSGSEIALQTSSTMHEREHQHALIGKHILVAEDNLINQMVISEFLKQAGADVIIASNGLEAIELLAKKEVDAILMDIQMPKMDGFAATLKIREQAQYRSLVIIGLSAGVTAHEADDYISVGMDDFIAKPIDADLLINKLVSHIQRESISH